MTWPIQDHCDAFLALLSDAPGGPPDLTVCDAEVPDGTVSPYALVYFFIETPGGLLAPDAVPLHLDSDVIDARAYVHSVGAAPEGARAARAVAGRVRAGVLNLTLSIPGRSCFPIRWLEGQSPQRNEEVPGRTVFDQVDIYGWRSLPA